MSRIPLLSLSPADARRPAGPWHRLVTAIRALRGDAAARRARRVVLLIAAIWLMNFTDLALTLFARDIGGFHELNPIARPLIGSTGALIVFKVSLVSISSLIMLTYRRHLWTELGCWVLLSVYTGLSFVWMQYYSHAGNFILPL
ncbi:MAG: DUF5658 family protein [Planctomycetota bacterium]